MLQHLPRALVVLLVALAALATACSDGASDVAATTSTAPTTQPPATVAPAPTTTVPPSPSTTALDPELSCLRTALADRPDLLDTLLGGAADAEDLLPALVVARDCLDRADLLPALSGGLRRALSVEVSDFQATCLAEQVLELPTEELDALVGSGDSAERLAGRVLRLCEVEG